MKLYKVLKKTNNVLKSPFRKFTFEVGCKYICEDFDLNPYCGCSRGFYATDIDGLVYIWCDQPEFVVYEVEVGGQAVEYNQFKRRYSEITLLREVPRKELKELALTWEPKVGYKLSEVLFPINPLKIVRNNRPTDDEIELLIKWINVGDIVNSSVSASVSSSIKGSVWDSVWDSVSNNVGDIVSASVSSSIKGSVWDSVWDSVSGSIWSSVSAYVSSFFPNIKKWEYIDHKPGVNPFQPGIDIWRAGFVPSYDGKVWRLHSGENAEIVYEREIDK